VPTVAEVADILQIPGFLCRQTDLIVAAALSERVCEHQERTVRLPLGHEARGRQCHGLRQQARLRHRARFELRLHNLVVDMRSLAIMRKFAPVVFDATHSVQLPSSSHGDDDVRAVSGGQPEFIRCFPCRRGGGCRRRLPGSTRQSQGSQVGWRMLWLPESCAAC